MAAVSPTGIDRLIGRDRVQPRTESATFLELSTLEMDLEESGLKRILSHFRIAQVPSQVTIQLVLVAMNQARK